MKQLALVLLVVSTSICNAAVTLRCINDETFAALCTINAKDADSVVGRVTGEITAKNRGQRNSGADFEFRNADGTLNKRPYTFQLRTGGFQLNLANGWAIEFSQQIGTNSTIVGSVYVEDPMAGRVRNGSVRCNISDN